MSGARDTIWSYTYLLRLTLVVVHGRIDMVFHEPACGFREHLPKGPLSDTWAIKNFDKAYLMGDDIEWQAPALCLCANEGL